MFLYSFERFKKKRFLTSSCLSVRPSVCTSAWNDSVPTGTIFMIFRIRWLTHSTVQSPSWAANWFAASQEIPRISRNPKVHYRTHKRPPPVSILSGFFLSPEQASCMWVFLNKDFYREGLLAPRPTPKLEDHPMSAVRDCLFNLFAATHRHHYLKRVFAANSLDNTMTYFYYIIYSTTLPHST